VSGLTFSIVGARPKARSVSPAIAFRLRITSPASVEAMVLRVDVCVEPQWREYSGDEQVLLEDLFGRPERWGTTLRMLRWADVPLTVTAFECETETDVIVPCTYDFEGSATRFFHALLDGEIPVRFLFSGTVFYAGASGFSCERVPWSAEAGYRVPVALWHEAMRACYGDYALIRVSADTLRTLHRLRSLSGAIGWDDFFERFARVGDPT
jgi:hypothetical protein